MSASEPHVADALRRATIYRLLALAWAYPTPARLEAIATSAGAPPDDAGAPGVRPALARLGEAAARADVAALGAEYVSLFDRAVPCPPYEGAYLPPQMSGKAAQLADIAGFYRAFGLEPGAWQPDLEDHVGAELEFMSALALKEAWALAEDLAESAAVTRQAQCAFLAEHLGRWGTAFAAQVGATAVCALYKEAAELLTTWLAAEAERLDVTLAPVAGPAPSEDEPFTCPMAAPEPDADR
jgi:TorA maturation chaperone TorD